MTIVFLVLVATTLACILVMLASMFTGRAVKSVQAAGTTIWAIGGALYALQHSTVVSSFGLKGIGWIVALPGQTVTAMSIIGGALVAMSFLVGFAIPVRMYMGYKKPGTPIISGERKARPSFRGRLNTYGQRFMSARFAKHSDASIKKDDR